MSTSTQDPMDAVSDLELPSMRDEVADDAELGLRPDGQRSCRK